MSWRSFFNALFQRPIGAPSNQPFVFSDAPPVAPPPAPVARKAPSVACATSADPYLTFKEALRLAALVSDETINSLPILGHVHLSEGRLLATCLDQYLVIDLPELHLSRPVCASLRTLKELATQCDGMPSLTLDGDTLVINDSWRLPTLEAAEFPVPPFQQVARNEIQLVDDVFPVPADLAALFPAMSTDESREQLRGVCFDQRSGKLVSSNGHVLYVLEGLAKGERQFTVPADALKVVDLLQRRAPAQAGYYAPVLSPSQKPDIPDKPDTTKTAEEPSNDRDFVCFTIPGVQLWTRLITIEFPDYPQVMPHEQSIGHRLTLPRAPLIDALSGALPFLPKKERPDSAKNGALFYSVRPREGVLHYESTETGDYHVTFPAPGWPVGFHVGLNVRYLLSALKSVPGNPEAVEVAFGPNTHPTRWVHGDFTVVIMPMRVFDRFPDELQTIIDAQRAGEEHADLARMEADERSATEDQS